MLACSPYLNASAALDRVKRRFDGIEHVVHIDGRTGFLHSVIEENGKIWLQITVEGQTTPELFVPGFWEARRAVL